MKTIPILLTATLLLLGTGSSYGDEVRPRVIVYSSDMPNLSVAIAAALSDTLEGDLDVIAVTEPSLLSSYLGLPDTAGVVLATIKSIELQELGKQLFAYFRLGGALVGFQGALNQQNVGDLAREVFPAFGNATGSFVTKDGTPVNEYSRSEVLEGFEELPDNFDLVGQFFVYCAGPSREVIEPDAAGKRTVLFRDSKTAAPLVIAYQNDEGSRSVGFSGFFVREQENARNYYGKLLDSPVFLSLLESSLTWTLNGSSRLMAYTHSQELIESERERIQELKELSAKEESSKRTRRLLVLVVIWAMGILSVGGLVWLSFIKPVRGD